MHDLVVVELFDVKYYRDLEMWVRGHSRSLKVVPFGVKQWPGLVIWVWGRLRSLKMARLDRPCMTFY